MYKICALHRPKCGSRTRSNKGKTKRYRTFYFNRFFDLLIDGIWQKIIGNMTEIIAVQKFFKGISYSKIVFVKSGLVAEQIVF